MEFNEGMIAEGRAACRTGITWIRGNAFELPFADRFDFAYSFRFVRHFHRPDRDRLYGQFHAVLRPGGTLMFDAVNAEVSRPLRMRNPEMYPIYDKMYSGAGDLKAELRQAGFELVNLQPVQRWFSVQYGCKCCLSRAAGGCAGR